MIGKKINQLATELAPESTDLTIIGDPISGVSKKITLAQLGAIFSGAVSFYNDLASFPVSGDINVIYCAKDTQKLYLWSGSAYVEVFPSQSLLDTYQLRSEKGVSNGYASLDVNGKVPIGQLPNSIMEYKGTWNAATNTPTLANGTGDTGDVYICNAAGTVNFGAGPITFAVGDYVVYSGTIWQRSSGAVGTVTSVGLSITGDSIGVTGSPITTSGTLALAFAGNSTQYINGAGSLTTFPSLTGYVPYTGATANVDLGTHTLSAYNLIINHTSGSGVAASITKGGNGEALTVVKSSGSGNAASITGGVTLLDELHLNTDLADAYIASASNWNDAYNLRHNAVTIGTANGLSLSTQVLSLALASGSTTGALSSTDWTTFNNKQTALTNPVTGTGTTNYLPKFTGTSTIGNSAIQEASSNIGIGVSPTNKLDVYGTSGTIAQIKDGSTFAGIIIDAHSSSTPFTRFSSSGTGKFELGYFGNKFYFNNNVGVNDTNAAMVITSTGNLGLGVTPSAWGGNARVFEGANGSALSSNVAAPETALMSNAFYNGSSWIYKTSSQAARFSVNGYNGSHTWEVATSGTAGNAISFTQAMTLNASGNLSIGNTNDTFKLDVTGTGRFTGQLNGNTGVNVGANALGADRMFQVSGTAFTSGAGQFGAVVNPTMGTLTTLYGIYVGTNCTSATNSYAIYIEGSGGTVTNKYGVYQAGGSDRNYFAGNVGIGTNNPGQRLSVRSADNTSATNIARFAAENNTLAIGIGYETIRQTETGGILAFETNGTERMRITSGGNVGIGTNNPTALLQVRGPNATGTFFDAQNDGAAGATFVRVNANSFPFNQYTFANGNVIISSGSIRTGAPTNGTSQPWKFGNAVSGGVTTNHYLVVEINGQAYTINAFNGFP